MIDNDSYQLPDFYHDIAKISSILLRKDITTKEIYIILLSAKLLNKDFNLEHISSLLEHLESLFTYLQNNKFSNKEEFNKWEKQMMEKINKKQENI